MTLLKAKFIIPIALIALLAIDHGYFNQLKQRFDGGALNERFLRKGRLGELLHQNNLLKLSEESMSLAKHGMCANNAYFKGFDYHNKFRMRFKLLSTQHDYIHVKLQILNAKRYRRVETVFIVRPGKEYYDLAFFADKNRDIKLTFSSHPQSTFSIEEIIIDGQFGRSHTLVSDGQPLTGEFSFGQSVSDTPKPRVEKKIYYSANQALSPTLFAGVFPGKKKQGFCNYVVNNGPLQTPVSVYPNQDKSQVVPRVNLTVETADLYGETGLYNNKEMKGILWEVPALYTINHGKHQEHQQVGLRFHGGKPGRKKDILSFRINARKHYGLAEINTEPLFGSPRTPGAKGVVFKYTYQAYIEKKINYNPFNHALALDIANAVGAIVPPHALVDFNINQQSQGLFLAMEHLSERGIKNWLGHDKFTTYTYKKFNSKEHRDRLLIPLGAIMEARGEETLKRLNKNYDINNVINSILLSAFIADDDFCQGIEIIESAPDPKDAKITSINWDLDHAFLSYENGQFSMPAKRHNFPAFRLLIPNKNMRESLCPRKWAYAHVYQQSPTFRQLIRTRLEALLADQLAPTQLQAMLKKYQVINQHYYHNAYTGIINELADFMQKRPSVLLSELTELEQSISN